MLRAATYIVMGDADDTYPLNELSAFVERLESGDDLVIGSRFKGTIHGDAMPFLNRFVGNPILTGMLNVLFGVKVSDAHCGMRASAARRFPYSTSTRRGWSSRRRWCSRRIAAASR